MEEQKLQIALENWQKLLPKKIWIMCKTLCYDL